MRAWCWFPPYIRCRNTFTLAALFDVRPTAKAFPCVPQIYINQLMEDRFVQTHIENIAYAQFVKFIETSGR
jgi:hypothetical protein